MKKIMLALLAFLLLFASVPFSACAASDVTVQIDGETIDFDVAPEMINGRTMVPMRRIFEYLGADVEWYDYDRSIYASCGYWHVSMWADRNEMVIGDNAVTLDVAPTVRNGRTLVPLRAVAESFSADVAWDGDTRTVKITTKYPKNRYAFYGEFDDKHIRTSLGSTEYLDFQISTSTLLITAYTTDETISQFAVSFGNGNWNGSIGQTVGVSAGTPVTFRIDLSKEEIDSYPYVNIWTRKGLGSYWSYICSILRLSKNGSEYTFQKPLVWDNNKEFMENWVNPIGYIKSDIDPTLVALSNEICKGAASDYEKILKIHDWVADNIYYNYDYYYDRSEDVTYTALGVYESRRTVCEGYANLTQALIQAQNIPCRKVHGYSLGVGSLYRYWTEDTASKTDSNHAWNQAYVDNRWVNIDTTWNSGNRYRDGEFQYKGIENHFYFDISDVFFSYNHKYLSESTW